MAEQEETQVAAGDVEIGEVGRVRLVDVVVTFCERGSCAVDCWKK